MSYPQSLFCQVNLIFPTIYIICSILVTLVPMIASPKETGEIVKTTHKSMQLYPQASDALSLPVEYPFTSSLCRSILFGNRSQFGDSWVRTCNIGKKNICFPPSQHNNRIAEAVCGGDAGEKIGLKFNEDCTTLVPVHKVAKHPHVSQFNRAPNFRQEFSFSDVA